ncbi:AlkZ-related protein [Bariatricus sp. SGI.154]|uniref:AlkZ-related protein n=1 Tax=Bariatricus sp. SGI.154 TaxID=3420549 RepID=UPI003D08905D
MAVENGEWIMHGLEWDNPYRIRTYVELINWVDEIGFLPLFKNEIEGFSAEEHTSDQFWWTGDPEQDPWKWRELIARSGRVAYGKFFNKKAGFISKEWFPYFANYRRDGYDFEARWDEELASARSKKIVEQFANHEELYSFELKKLAGFGKNGEKNFEGVVTELQMQTYLVARDFRQKVNKKGVKCGWPVAVYSTPEQLWGYEVAAGAYAEEPTTSKERIFEQVRRNFQGATEKQLMKVLR